MINILFRKILFFSLLVSALIATFYSSKLLIGSDAIQSPRSMMDYWACVGNIGDGGQWHEQKALVEKALGNAPLHAQYWSDYARMYELISFSQNVWNKETKENRLNSIKYYRQSAQLRPTWGLAWLNLAQSKVLNQELDKEAFAALRKAYKYGRWQDDVQRRLLWLSIGLWQSLPEDIKEETRRIVRNKVQNDKEMLSMVLLSLRYSWQKDLRALLTRDDHIAMLDKYEKDRALTKRLLSASFNKQACTVG